MEHLEVLEYSRNLFQIQNIEPYSGITCWEQNELITQMFRMPIGDHTTCWLTHLVTTQSRELVECFFCYCPVLSLRSAECHYKIWCHYFFANLQFFTFI